MRSGRHRTAHVALVAVASLAGIVATGCTTLERSRDLGNANVSGKTLAVQVCSNCHGVDGNSTSPNFPRLAGQSEAYLAAQLKSFRARDRRDPAGFEYMWGLSRKLTDEQIAGLAAYFHAQSPRANPAGSGTHAQAGKAIFENGLPDQHVPACASCHGPDAKGTDQFPRLAAQHANYVKRQLVVFQQKTDARPGGAVMRVVVHELEPDQIGAIADYVQGLDAR